MKKIALITTNKVLAQSLAAAVRQDPALMLEPVLLLNHPQATLDAEVLKIDIALVDVTEGTPEEAETALGICQRLRQTLPACRLLALVCQNGRNMVLGAMKSKMIDDFVCYDTSLACLLAKLAAF